jgi:hypothetical protein
MVIVGLGAATTAAADSTPPSSTAAPSGVSVTISDGVNAARTGDRLTYQVTVINDSSRDVQMLLEISLPDYAKVVDAGGGTMRTSLIDYGITVRAGSQTSEKFVVTVGAIGSDEQRLSTVASVYLLGKADTTASTSNPDIGATDSDALPVNATSTAGAGAGGSGGGHSANSGSSNAAGSSKHTGLWIGALVLGAVLTLVGLIMAFGRRARGAKPAPPLGAQRRQSTDGVNLPSRSQRRAAEAAADAGIRTGSHQAHRPVR